MYPIFTVALNLFRTIFHMTFLSLISLYLPAKDYEYIKDVLKKIGNNIRYF